MKLVLAGGSSHTDSYETSFEATNRTRFVSCRGFRETILMNFFNAALFVLPSELEGLSLALLDAMASGVCVLTSDIPENNEVVEGAGFTFHRGDRRTWSECWICSSIIPNFAAKRAFGNGRGSRANSCGRKSRVRSKEPITRC